MRFVSKTRQNEYSCKISFNYRKENVIKNLPFIMNIYIWYVYTWVGIILN